MNQWLTTKYKKVFEWEKKKSKIYRDKTKKKKIRQEKQKKKKDVAANQVDTWSES